MILFCVNTPAPLTPTARSPPPAIATAAAIATAWIAEVSEALIVSAPLEAMSLPAL